METEFGSQRMARGTAMLRVALVGFLVLLSPVIATAPAQSQPGPTSSPSAPPPGIPSSPSVAIQCKFRLVVVRGESPNPPTEIEFDYTSRPSTALAVEGVGAVPPQGTLHFVTRSQTLRFSDPTSNAVLASFSLPQQIEAARTELKSLGGSPAERLRRGEILHMLGEDAAAIPDLAKLASAGSLPLSTRNLASLQLGRAFAAVGEAPAALSQYNRVSLSASPSARGEALVRTSDVQLSSGNEAGAAHSLGSFFATKSFATSPYALQADTNQRYLAAQKSSPRTFSATTPLLSVKWKPDEDASDDAFHELPGTRPWKNIETYESVVEALWQNIFQEPPGTDPCHEGLLCSTTSYWVLQKNVNGRFVRVAFRVSRWYAADVATTKNLYKIEYSAQEELIGAPNTWGPIQDEGVKGVIHSLLNDFSNRLRILGNLT